MKGIELIQWILKPEMPCIAPLISWQKLRIIIYCHYASPAAFVSIFDSYIRKHEHKPITECTMRASHTRLLNDSNEYFDGLKWLQRLFNEEKISPDSLSDDIYSISFCGNEDLLSQWKW